MRRKQKEKKVFFPSISNKNYTDDSRHMTNTHTTLQLHVQRGAHVPVLTRRTKAGLTGKF